MILNSGDNALITCVARVWIDTALQAISTVLVDPREYVQLILPATQDEQVAGRIGVGNSRGAASPITPSLHLEVTILRVTFRRQRDASVLGQSAHQPRGMVARSARAQATIFQS